MDGLSGQFTAAGVRLPKGVFGSVDIHWLAGDIHFSGGCPLFGLEDEVVRDIQI
jgi:hypothetical protein